MYILKYIEKSYILQRTAIRIIRLYHDMYYVVNYDRHQVTEYIGIEQEKTTEEKYCERTRMIEQIENTKTKRVQYWTTEEK